MTTVSAPTFVGRIYCISVVLWTHPLLLTNIIFWLHFSFFTFDHPPYYLKEGQPENAVTSDDNVDFWSRREGKMPSDRMGLPQMVQHYQWHTRGNFARSVWAMAAGASSKSSMPAATSWGWGKKQPHLWEISSGWNTEPPAEGAVGGAEQTAHHQEEIDRSYDRTWTPHCMEGGAGRWCSWTSRGDRMLGGESWKLASSWQEESSFPSWQLCIYRVDLTPW